MVTSACTRLIGVAVLLGTRSAADVKYGRSGRDVGVLCLGADCG